MSANSSNPELTVTLNDTAAPVVCMEHATASGHVLAQLELNVPGTLNSLSLEMIDLLRPALTHWAQRSDVVAVLITGSGDKAFCAGGDIQALYHAIVRNHAAGETVDSYPFDFFEREYRLDYQIHTYPKPVVALGHGIVMGGGFGIFGGSRYRLVTERTRLAFPEVTIGLFPDAGGTWLLRNMPIHLGVFLGMTGSHLNAADALASGVGTHCIAAAQRPEVLAGLLQLPWAGFETSDHETIASWLAQLASAPTMAAETAAIPTALNADGSVAEIAERVRALAGASAWVDRGIAAMNAGCPTSVGVVVEQLKRAPALDLDDCFRLEMTVGTHCALEKDFVEGVRALLIDKDGAPNWQHASVAALPQAHVDGHFAEPWDVNPLHDLGGL
ncbi:MAG: enoyl-CoA hydratase/isomerase family protein [Pseudomonadales bacterium]